MFVLMLDNIVLNRKSNLRQVDSLKSQHGDLEKQLESLKLASEPKKDEVDRVRQLEKIISAEEKEIDRLTQGSKKLKEKVMRFYSLYSQASFQFVPYLALQNFSYNLFMYFCRQQNFRAKLRTQAVRN